MKIPGEPNKMLVRKVRSVWIGDCPGCPVSVGFVIRPTWGLAMAWAGSHTAWHRGQIMADVERRIDCHEGCCDD